MQAFLSQLTPRFVLRCARVAAGLCAVGMTLLLLGPFQGLEAVVGLGDKPAHAIAFFIMTSGLFLVAPRWRRTDVVLVAILVAVLSELLQGLTGRSMSLTDGIADGVGAGLALVPSLIETLRRQVRRTPDLTFAEIAQRDRRMPRAATRPTGLDTADSVR